MKKFFATGLVSLLLPLMAAASTVVGHANSTVVSDGLVGYWPMDGNTTDWRTGKTTDMSSSGNTGTLISMSTSTTPAAGKVGGALTFSGSNQISLGSMSALTTFTISGWVRLTAAPHAYDIIFVTKDSGGGNGIDFRFESGKLKLYSGGGTSLVVTASTYGPANGWMYVTATRDSSGVATIYINGVVVASGTLSAPNAAYFSTPLIGNYSVGRTDTGFQGQIDDLRVYNRGLSASEVQQLYTNGGGVLAHSNVSLSTGLVGYWPLDGNVTSWTTGQTKDTSGNGNTGSFVGMSTSTSPVSGEVGGALQGFSATSYIDVPTSSSLNPGNTITVSGWFYPTSNSSYAPFITKQPADGSAGWEMANSSGAFRATLRNSLVNVTAGSVVLNKWQFGTFTYDGTTLRLYLNGVLVGSATGSATVNSSADLLIGKRFLNNDYFRGKVDDVRVYNRVLSANEIAQLYKNGGGTVAQSNAVTLANGLVGYLPLDGALTNWVTGITRDLSGSGNNGTLNGLSTSTAQVAGRVGGAMQFSGATTQYVQAGGFTSLGTSNKPYTLAAWVKPSLSSETGDILHVSANSTGLGWCLSMIQISSGKAKALSWLPNPSVATGATTLLPNKWYHIVHTWSASGGLQLYVNGVLDASTPQATFSSSGLSDYVSVGSPVTGATCSNDAGTGFGGSIDDVRVYNRELSASEVKLLYTATK